MANTPIVARRMINLDWITWLKGFVIHPSVYEGAAGNMKEARIAKANNERKRLEAIAEAEAPQRTATLIKNIQEILKAHPAVQEQFNYIFTDSRAVLAEKAEVLWIEVNRLEDKALKLQLLAQFKILENPTYSVLVDIATTLNKLDSTDGNYWAFEEFNRDQARMFFPREERTIAARTLVERNLPHGELRNQLLDQLKPLFPQLLELQVAPTQQAAEASVPQVKPYVGSYNILQGAFLKTFGLDGFKVSSTETTDAQGKDYSFDQRGGLFSEYPHIPFSLALLTFLGFPNRLHNGNARIDFREFIRNLVGGWDSLNNGNNRTGLWWTKWKNYSFEGKRLWNVILLPIKLFVILPLKLILFPLKLALNCVKLFTEFFPEVLLNISGVLLGYAGSALFRMHHSNRSVPSKIIPGALTFLLAIVFASIHYVARLWSLVGTALTSPEKSARMAWDYGRSVNSRLGYVFGTLGAAISVALSATLWTLLFPIAISEALVMIPSLAPIVTSILQLPIIANVINLLNGTSIAVAGILPSVFNTIAVTSSAVLGITISASTVAFAAIATFIAAPVVAVASRLADEMSNLWTRWTANSPLLIAKAKEPSALQFAALAICNSAKRKRADIEMGPSKRATAQTGEFAKLVETSDAAEQTATARIPSSHPYQAQDRKKPAPGLDCAPPVRQVSYY